MSALVHTLVSDAPHWFAALCLGLVALAYLVVAVASRVALHRQTASRARADTSMSTDHVLPVTHRVTAVRFDRAEAARREVRS